MKVSLVSLLISSATAMAASLAITASDFAASTISTSNSRPSAALQRRQWSHHQIWCHNETDWPIWTYGEHDNGGPGLLIWNYDPYTHSGIGGTMFFIYESNHDFVPYKVIIIPPWKSAFVTVCPTFEGRIVRGDWSYFDGQKHLLGTWVEVSYQPDGMIYGDVSLLEGNDGGAMVQSLDGFYNARGFTYSLLEIEAPYDAWAQKSNGAWCLGKLVGVDANEASYQWQSRFLDPWNVYLTNSINPVIDSINGRMQITFYQGSI